MSERNRPSPYARAGAWGAGLLVAGLAAHTAIEHQANEPTPLDRQPGIAHKLMKTGEIPEGYALHTVGAGETPITIARKYGASDISATSEKILEQIGRDGDGVQAGEDVLLKVSEFDDAVVGVTNVPAEKTGLRTDTGYVPMPYLYTPEEVKEK